MSSLIAFFVDKRLAVGVLAFIIIIFGTVAYLQLPREAAPDLKIPVVLVAVPYPGVSPTDIESLIINKLETNFKNLRDIKTIHSTSAEGVGLVSLEFDPSIDIDEAVRKVREKVDITKPDLPKDALEPDVREVSFADFPIITINIAADYSAVRLKNVAEDLQEKLEGIAGVLDVKLGGGLEREIQVLADPGKLALHGIGIGELIGAIRRENINLPGGAVNAGDASFLVRVPGELKTAAEIEDIVVRTRGRAAKVSLRVGDVARVVDSYKERDSLSRINRTDSVSLSVTKRGGENMIEITDEIKRIINEEIKTLPPGTQITLLQDQSKFVRDMVSDLQNNILTGLLLIVFVLPFFLTIRSSIIVGSAIPLALLLSMILIDAFGMTLNMIVLFSLILSLGMLVDNSIVVVENTYRLLSEGMPRVRAAVQGTTEVAWPVIASTATTVAAFLPLIFWPGVMGKFMGFLPRTLIITLLSSLFVALFINPVMCVLFLRVNKKHVVDENSEPTGWMYGTYRRVLQVSMRRWYLTLPAVFVLLVGTMLIFAAMHLGVEFFPEGTPDSATIDIRAADGTRLAATNEIVTRIEKALDGDEHIKNFVAVVGQSGGGNAMAQSGAAPHLAMVQIDFYDSAARTENSNKTVERIRERLSGIVGARFEVKKPAMGPPAGAPVQVELVGKDWKVLGALTKTIVDRLESIDNVVDVHDDYSTGRPEVQIRVDRQKARLAGTSTLQVAQAIRAAINGTEATKLRDGTDEYDVMVRYQDGTRDGLQDLRRILVSGRDGAAVPLSEVATITTEAGAGSIRHKDHERVITISANVDGRLATEVQADVAALLTKEKFPAGYSWRITGENEEQGKAQAFLLRAFVIAGLMILAIIVLQFNSLISPTIIMTSVLLSTIGVFWGLIIFQKPFGVVMTGLGVISLAGVAVNNAIVLIDFINNRRKEMGEDARQEAIIQAGVIRLRPVLLTAITTVLGLLPMVFGVTIDFFKGTITFGGRSAEMWSSMAIAVAFGLIFTTFLTLIVVPVLYELGARLWLAATRLFPGDDDITSSTSTEGGSSSTSVPATKAD